MERRECASVMIVSVRLVMSATDVVVVGFGHRVESRNRPANSSQGGFLISDDRAPSNGDPALPTMWRWNFKAEQKKPPKRDQFFLKRPLRDGPDGQAVVGLLPHSICWGRWDAVDVGRTPINGSEGTQFTFQQVQAVQWSSRGARWRLEFRNRTSAGPALDRGACCCWCCGGGGAELQNRTPPRPKNLEQNTPSMRSVL